MSRIDNTSFLISQTSTEFTFCCRRLLFSGLKNTVIALLDYWPYFGASLFFENPLRKSLNSPRLGGNHFFACDNVKLFVRI